MSKPASLAAQSLAGAALTVLTLAPNAADAHGFAGKRFFPATLTFDDPFPADEFDLQYTSLPNAAGEDGAVDLHVLDFEYAKSVTPGFALSVGSAYVDSKFPDNTTRHGFDNIGVAAKLMGGVDAASESVWSYGLDVDLGGTSSHAVGESYSVYSPSFFFGKGFGNLFDPSSYLRPLAVAGKVFVSLPEQDVARTLGTDFALQYSLTYLETAVKDTGLPRFLRDSVLLIEMPLQTCLDHGCDGDVTGTVNPGVIFFNSIGQLSLEAVIPVNSRTGDSVGGLLQLHFYLDDVFPHSLGKPLFD